MAWVKDGKCEYLQKWNWRVVRCTIVYELAVMGEKAGIGQVHGMHPPKRSVDHSVASGPRIGVAGQPFSLFSRGIKLARVVIDKNTTHLQRLKGKFC